MTDRYIPEPTVIMFGCQSITARRHTPADCPACKGGIRPGHDTRHCGVCDSSSPAIESRIKAARLGLKAHDKAEDATKRYRAKLADLTRTELSETHRREIWNGYTGHVSAEDEPTNRARECREFLRKIGQEPDWSLVRDEHGRWVRPVTPL